MPEIKKKAKKEAKDLLSTGRIQLVITKPFWGHIALGMPMIESESAGGQRTTAVDANGRFYYNKNHIENMNIYEVIFELAHEVMHIVQHCNDRYPPGADPELWNLAADYAADTTLVEAGFKQSEISKKMVPKEVQQFAKGKTTEQIYWALIKKGEKSKGPGQGGGQQPGSGDPGPGNCPGNHPKNVRGCATASLMGQKKKPEAVEKFKQQIIAAAQLAKDRGDLPGFANDFIVKLMEPTVTWRDKLRNMSATQFKGRYSFARPSRRSHAIGLRLPFRKPAKEGAIIAIDTSGSISDKELCQFVTECTQIMRETGAPWIKIYFHDVLVHHIEEYNFETIQKVKAGRGGTSHIDVFKKIEDSDDRVGMVICFTDLYTTFPPDEPSFPVIWAHSPSGASQGVPWGQKVQVNLDE